MGLGPDLFAQLSSDGLEVELRARNATPLARGLGSSAACRVASCEAYRRLTGSIERPAWELASQLEGHPDNAGPAGLGGLFVGTKAGDGRFRALQPTIHPCWRLVVAVPNFNLLTEKARAVLPSAVPRADVIYNLGHLPFLLEGLRTGDGDFLRLGCQDRVHQNQRAELIPGYWEVLRAAEQGGAAAAYLSGAGPTLAAFVDFRRGENILEAVSHGMQSAFQANGVESHVEVMAVDKGGLEVMELEPEEQVV
jgi:homoserine kinase